MIRADPRNLRAQELLKSLDGRLPPLPEDLVLVLGGDGHMLAVIHALGVGKTYLGLNCGRIGFLLNDPPELEVLLEVLGQRRWMTREVSRLKLEGHTVEGKKVFDRALNDIYLERMTGQTAHLELSVDGKLLVASTVTRPVRYILIPMFRQQNANRPRLLWGQSESKEESWTR